MTGKEKYTSKKVKKVKRSIAVNGTGNHLTATGDHMLDEITQCYLPPGSGDFPANQLHTCMPQTCHEPSGQQKPCTVILS